MYIFLIALYKYSRNTSVSFKRVAKSLQDHAILTITIMSAREKSLLEIESKIRITTNRSTIEHTPRLDSSTRYQSKMRNENNHTQLLGHP